MDSGLYYPYILLLIVYYCKKTALVYLLSRIPVHVCDPGYVIRCIEYYYYFPVVNCYAKLYTEYKFLNFPCPWTDQSNLLSFYLKNRNFFLLPLNPSSKLIFSTSCNITRKLQYNLFYSSRSLTLWTVVLIIHIYYCCL